MLCRRVCTSVDAVVADTRLNRVQRVLYFSAHRHEFIAVKLSETARCRHEALPAQNTAPNAATSAATKTPQKAIKDSPPAPAAEAPCSAIDAAWGHALKAGRDFFQLASAARTWIACCAVLYVCIASFCTRKQIHRRAPPCGRLVLAVLAITVLLQLLSTVGAAKVRPFRDAKANAFAEGKPSANYYHALAAGPDRSLYVFGGRPEAYMAFMDNQLLPDDLLKLDLDAGGWLVVEPRGSVRPSARMEANMVFVGSDLYLMGGWKGETAAGTRLNDLWRFSTLSLQWEQLDAATPTAGGKRGQMVAVGEDLFVSSMFLTALLSESAEEFGIFRFSTTAKQWQKLDVSVMSADSSLLSESFVSLHKPTLETAHTTGRVNPVVFSRPVMSSMVAVENGDIYLLVIRSYCVEMDLSDPACDPAISCKACRDGPTITNLIVGPQLFRISRSSLQSELVLDLASDPLNPQPLALIGTSFTMASIGSDLLVFGSPGRFRISTTSMQLTQLAVVDAADRASTVFGHLVSVGADWYVYTDEIFGEQSSSLWRFSTNTMQWTDPWEHLDAVPTTTGISPDRAVPSSIVAMGDDFYALGRAAGVTKCRFAAKGFPLRCKWVDSKNLGDVL